ncbi:MAG TPA: 2,3-bisphosphoglycerate-independent phosphoglycerate mutase [Candidatus Babeliales bacterium]|nr:2,3-bisphosphoglycerate-independent phosphoglycerate mutase [Candidatus Babeliales bacterium]
MKRSIPTALVILDGFGYSDKKDHNAIHHAKTPNLDAWFSEYPHTLLNAAGAAVGLPNGYMSNSEVGHITIGTGRVLVQPVTMIHNAITNKSFFSNKTLLANVKKIHDCGGSLHIMGLLSDAGVHSDLELLYAILGVAYQQKIARVFIHAFLDGRDAPPKSAVQYLEQLDQALMTFEYGSIASLHGRFYAMDRNNNWDRTEKSYRVLVDGQPSVAQSWDEVIQDRYDNGVTDEFIEPVQLDPTSTVQDGDGIIFINFREDRARQLTAAFVDPEFKKFKTKGITLSCFITPIQYDPTLKTTVLFEQQAPRNTLKDVLAAHHKTIFSIAETEKYAHVTYFFTGKKEYGISGETVKMIPSLIVDSYAQHPCMSAVEITKAVCDSLEDNPCDFYLINYANTDMVGHSGDFDATVQAVECLDEQLEQLFALIVEKMDGVLYITADHGKAEEMASGAGNVPRTAHTNNPVPFIMMSRERSKAVDLQSLKGLADIAPFILKNMGIAVPREMSGEKV